MPSEIANKIVDHIFGDEKAKALDATNDALSAASYDAIQAKKIEFAQQWGFNPDQTGQAAADELEKSMPDGTEAPELAPTATEIAQQEQEPEVQQPEASVEPTEDQPVEEPEDETDS